MVVAYSPLAFLITIIFGSLMVLAMGVIGFKKLKPCVLVGNNSLAIVAAYHPLESDEGAAYKKVGWGAVRHEENGVPGHCTFTSQEVELPREGDWYLRRWYTSEEDKGMCSVCDCVVWCYNFF